MMAGAYVGLAIILIYSLCADAIPAYRHLIMGASFGVIPAEINKVTRYALAIY